MVSNFILTFQIQILGFSRHYSAAPTVQPEHHTNMAAAAVLPLHCRLAINIFLSIYSQQADLTINHHLSYITLCIYDCKANNNSIYYSHPLLLSQTHY